MDFIVKEGSKWPLDSSEKTDDPRFVYCILISYLYIDFIVY